MNRLATALALTLFSCILPASALAQAGPDTVARAEQPRLPIVLTLFLHDQLTEEEVANLGPDYLSWFIKDLVTITGRQVEVVLVRNKAGYTDFDYRLGDADKSLYEWDQRIIDYVINNRLPRGKRHKYLLITRNNLTLLTEGIAGLGKRSAIASLTAYRTIAHEVGHLLGATHADGEFHATAAPLPCNTNMVAGEIFLIKNCYLYSEQSAQVIRNYLKDTP